jgi:CheY-like chemotaxis protein
VGSSQVARFSVQTITRSDLKSESECSKWLATRCWIATRAHEALELFRGHRIDLVLAEHIAPASIDGPTLAETMKMLKPEIPIAILSADVQASPEDQRFADAFITKLAPVDELLRTIRKLLKKRLTACLPLAA